jgi:DNA-binding NtrC family response regulator
LKQESKRILIIDDDKLILSSLKQILELEGYQVDTAENGNEAIEKSMANFYNLALIDIRLPDMEGTQLLLSMKETTPKMRKIILTGYPDLKNAVTALKGAADDYITKPTKLDELVKRVKDQLYKQDNEQQYGERKIAEYIESRLRAIAPDDNESNQPN